MASCSASLRQHLLLQVPSASQPGPTGGERTTKTFVPTKFLISIPVGIMDRGIRGEREKNQQGLESLHRLHKQFFPFAVYHAAANMISDMIAGNFCALPLLRSLKLTPLRARGNHRCTYVEHFVLKSTLTSLLRPVIQIMVGSRCFPSCQLVGMSPSPDIVQLHLTGPHNHQIKLSSSKPFHSEVQHIQNSLI